VSETIRIEPNEPTVNVKAWSRNVCSTTPSKDPSHNMRALDRARNAADRYLGERVIDLNEIVAAIPGDKIRNEWAHYLRGFDPYERVPVPTGKRGSRMVKALHDSRRTIQRDRR
jgi:hypothetical protein